MSSEKPVQYFPPQEPGNPADAHEQYVHPAIPDPPKRTALTPLIALSAALVVVGAAVALTVTPQSGTFEDAQAMATALARELVDLGALSTARCG